MTITSFTDTRKSYDTTETRCTCPDFLYRQSKVGGQCKHQQALIGEITRAQMFLRLMARFDIRSQAVIEAKRANYWNYEMTIAA